MNRMHSLLFLLGTLLLGLASLLSACSPSATAQPATPSPIPPTAAPNAVSTAAPADEWIIVDLPPGATQVEVGAEIYRLVCQDCHGNRGQGLTAEWRATWAPQDQNCWQSKCHGFNHPSDGFYMPIAPPVVGSAVTSQFATAQELHDLIQATMPWYHPGNLTHRDSWSLTAYILKLNQIDPGTQLSEQTASQISLK